MFNGNLELSCAFLLGSITKLGKMMHGLIDQVDNEMGVVDDKLNSYQELSKQNDDMKSVLLNMQQNLSTFKYNQDISIGQVDDMVKWSSSTIDSVLSKQEDINEFKNLNWAMISLLTVDD